jgi:hypothetical protein
MVSHESLLIACHTQPVGAVTLTIPSPPSDAKFSLVGEIMRGGFETVKFTLDVLLPLTGSRRAADADAVLPTTVPFATEQFSATVIVIVAEAPEASDVNVTLRLLPIPPQTPPPVEEHITNVTDAGRLSVTVIVDAGSGPLFVRVMVYVTMLPTTMGEAGETVLLIERSAAP